MTGNFEYVQPLSGGNQGQVSAIHVDNLAFKQDDGAYWQWRGCTDFLLYLYWLNGTDIEPILEDRWTAGANLVRVLGMVDSFAHFYPQEHPDYYSRLRDFADCIGGYGMKLEFVPFADASIIFPFEGDRAAHVNKIAAALSQHSAVFVEVANEPGHQDQVDSDEAQALGNLLRGHGFPVASGNYTLADKQTSAPRCDYVTIHVERDDEWPRKDRSLAENRDGFSWSDGSAFEGYHCPVVSDEPMGASDTNQPGKRSNVPEDFRYAGACTALMGAGGTFHSDAGILSQLWTPTQRSCAVAYFEGLTYVPVECQFAPYQRGGAGGGAGIGDIPIIHYDLEEHVDPGALRSYAKFTSDGKEIALAIRPTVSALVGRDGWRVIDQPWKGLGTLAR